MLVLVMVTALIMMLAIRGLWISVNRIYNLIRDSLMEYQYRKATKEVTTYFETLQDVIRNYRVMHWG